MLTLEWAGADGALQVINFDASIDEGYESTAEATEHAVEQGAAVSDHVRPNPDTLSFNAYVTNTPVVSALSQMDGAGENHDGVDLDVGGRRVAAAVTQWDQEFDRVGAVDAQLLALQRSGTLVKVYTGLRVVERLVITRYKVDRDADNGNALSLTLELKRIRIATTQRVLAPRRVRRPVQRGSAPATPAPLESVAHSGLRQIVNAPSS